MATLPSKINKTNPKSFPVDSNVLAMFGIFKQQSLMEITSFDGKPFLTPAQFGYLSYHQLYCLKEKQDENESPEKKGISDRVEEICKKNGRTKKGKLKENESDLDIETQNLEKIHKKVKVEDRMLSPSTQEEETSDFARRTKEIPLMTPEVAPKENPKKLRRIVRTDYNKDSQKLIFKVQSLLTTEKETSELTREEVLKEDPTMLLYFYENHLEFSKTPQFKPEKLKKI